MTQNPAEGKKTLLRSIFSFPAFSSPAKEQGEHEPYLKGVLDLVNSGVLIVKSCNRQIVWCNAAFQQMTGYQAAELAGLDVFHLIPVEWQKLLQKNLAKLIATGNQQAEHYALLNAKQQEIKVRVKSTLQLVDGEQVIIASFNDITDEQLAFHELERSAIETTALINSIDTYLWSMDLNLDFQQANSKARIMFRELYGINAGPGESYKKVLDNLPDQSARIWWQKLREVKASGQAVSFEISEIFINRFAHVKIKIQPICDSGGQIKALSCHVENNTEEYLRHQLLELLGRFKSQMIGVEDTEELLWLVTDEILAKLSFEDAQILMVEQNQLVARTAHGTKRIGKNKAVHPLTLNLGEGITGLVARSGKSEIVNDTRQDSRYYCRHFAGLSEVAVPIWIDDQVKGVINCESQYPGFFSDLHLEILTEVADLVSGKIKMLESSKHLYKMQMLNRAVLDSTPNSFMLLDPGNVVQSFNGTAMRVFKEVLNTELQIGDDFWQFVPGESAHEYEELFALALQGKIQKVQKNLQHDTLGKLWYKATLAPASNSAGEIFGVTLIIEDVTYSKESENLIIKQNDDLRKANQELDKFVYSVSHDLRAPIANVMGLTTILHATKELGEVKTYTGMIENTMKRMDEFIHNILDYSRNSRLAVIPEQVNLHQLIEELILDYYHIDAMKSIQFQNLVNSNFEVSTDSQRLRIILGNLISNAIKYHDPSKEIPGIEVSASLTRKTLVLIVKDNGQGIAQEHLPKLFEMFYTANLRSEGSGIGLYILQDAVNILGGKIEVKSELGSGTEFLISLPLICEV